MAVRRRKTFEVLKPAARRRSTYRPLPSFRRRGEPTNPIGALIAVVVALGMTFITATERRSWRAKPR